MVQRWQQLPLDRAQSLMPRVRLFLDDLARRPVPDLGPEVAMDQLTVLVYDACTAGQPGDLVTRLGDLRRSLS